MKSSFLLPAIIVLASCVAQPTMRVYAPLRDSAKEPVTLSESLSPSEQIVDMSQLSPNLKSSKLSDTVVRMAREAGCVPTNGANLLAKTSALETYQVRCQGGQQQLYMCEQGQCRTMN